MNRPVGSTAVVPPTSLALVGIRGSAEAVALGLTVRSFEYGRLFPKSSTNRDSGGGSP
jgi:hypothetical protein